ncbi:MAG TPA: bifunctional acetate--CoA ligase family protein/GNAT family N-acetyltransferase [Candidatus Angelobacter sp.]|nr:bifunctional acetate--CoA ligase family protein/GNAT family N-acetyltransferase [Candidatus Angelobacter sp.]
MRSSLVATMSSQGENSSEQRGRDPVPAWPPSPLAPIFHPRTVAVIGATEKPASVGRTVLRNLLDQPSGATIFPINPHRPNVLGIRCYPSIASIGEPVDLAIVVTPAATVPEVLQECVDAGVGGAIVISAGFAELGAAGKEREKKIKEVLASGRLRLIGPNCVGVMNPRTGLNATFAQANALPGNIAFLSQSGALCTAVLDWSRRENVGFSGVVSVGSMLDVSWGDLIYHYGDDAYTSSILIYMESIGDARSFLSAAREVALRKPIIVIKPGRTEAARKAAASHTGSITGSDEVFEAAFRRCGILRVASISELFDMAEVLSKQPRPRGPKLAVVTNAGGAGVLATDALLANGGVLAPLSSETYETLNGILPAAWSHANPVDTLGDSSPDVYVKALEVVANDPNCDAVLSILAPQGMTEPEQAAGLMRKAAESIKKPLLASWMGGSRMQLAANVLNEARIPTFEYPDAAARSFAYMWRYSSNLQALYETPIFAGQLPEDGPKRVAEILAGALSRNRTILTEYESKQVLAAYELPVTAATIASTADAAVVAAEELGYPVVLKLHSETVTHKSDRGGVKLELQDATEVRAAFTEIENTFKIDGSFNGVTVQPMIAKAGYELILGSSTDPQFGPVLVFGLGGQLVEVLRDNAHALPPLTTTLARRMMENTRILQALKGTRGRPPVDLEKLEELLVRFSELVIENPRIADIEINPLLVGPEGMVALDARVILHPASVCDGDLPRPAIRPYPGQYTSSWQAHDGTSFTLRPIRPDDEPLMVDFHHHLSEASVYMRFFLPLKLDFRVSHERLFTKCFIDYDREIGLVAEYSDEQHGRHIAAIGRLIRKHSDNGAEVAFLVADKFQNRGLGTHMLERIIEIARKEGISTLEGATLSDNFNMKDMFIKAGFRFAPPEDGVATAELQLT